MAVFTSAKELDVQDKTRNFRAVTGWKASALEAAGYKTSGEKTDVNKYLGGTPSSIIAGNILSQGTDTGDVIASQREDEIKHQLGVVELVGSIMSMGSSSGGGGGGAASGGASAGAGASGAATGASSGTWAGNTMREMTGGASGYGKNYGKNTGTTGSKASGALSGASSDAMTVGKGDAGSALVDSYVSGQKERTIEDMNTSQRGGMTDEQILNLKDEDVVNAGGSSSNKAGIVADSSENERMKSVTEYEGIGSHGVGMQAANLYQEKLAIADAHKRKAHSIWNQTTAGTNTEA